MGMERRSVHAQPEGLRARILDFWITLVRNHRMGTSRQEIPLDATEEFVLRTETDTTELQ
jgi:hypothetical protein